MLRSLRAALPLSIALAVLAPRPAAACSCGPGFGPFPMAGAIDVAIDVELVVSRHPDGPPFLRTAGGVLVPTEQRTEDGLDLHGWTILKPLTPLAADTDHEVVHPGGEVHGFRTGTRSARPVVPVDLERLSLATAARGVECADDDCSGDPRLAVALRTGEVAEGDRFFELELSSGAATWRRRVSALPDDLSNGACATPLPEFKPGEQWCARVFAIGEGGERAEAGTSACAELIDCGIGCGEDERTCLYEFQPPPSQWHGWGCRAGGDGAGGWLGVLVLAALFGRRRAMAVARQP